MLTAKRDIQEDDRGNYALILLESSGYVDPWKTEIAEQINSGSPDQIELLIQNLLLNQVDNWNNFRAIDINRRLDQC